MGEGRRRALRWSGNALIAAALVLAGWFAFAHAQGDVAQERLRDVAPEVLLADRPSSASASGPARVEMDGWEDEDGAYWGSLADGGVFGRLVAPDIGLDRLVVEGVEPTDLRKGPGRAPSTALPGRGNTGVSGHRTTYGAPFFRIGELRAGDRIDLYSPYRRYRYEVEWVRVVAPDAVEVFDATLAPCLTLTACHPWYSASRRIVVRASLVDVRRTASSMERRGNP